MGKPNAYQSRKGNTRALSVTVASEQATITKQTENLQKKHIHVYYHDAPIINYSSESKILTPFDKKQRELF